MGTTGKRVRTDHVRPSTEGRTDDTEPDAFAREGVITAYAGAQKTISDRSAEATRPGQSARPLPSYQGLDENALKAVPAPRSGRRLGVAVSQRGTDLADQPRSAGELARSSTSSDPSDRTRTLGGRSP
jgi:hypothetical protein